MDGTLQECGQRWLGLFAGHEAHGAGACRALRVKAESSDILASPGTMLAPAPFSTDRKQQKQHILTPVSAKATPAQRHAHHCSICGAARHTHTDVPAQTHTCARTHTHTRMRTCTHIQTQMRRSQSGGRLIGIPHGANP